MAWVVFTAPFDWSPPERNGLTTLAFAPAEEPRSVRRLCAEAAIAAGKAVAADPPEGAQPATPPPPATAESGPAEPPQGPAGARPDGPAAGFEPQP